jgi:hypothetical protein
MAYDRGLDPGQPPAKSWSSCDANNNDPSKSDE